MTIIFAIGRYIVIIITIIVTMFLLQIVQIKWSSIQFNKRKSAWTIFNENLMRAFLNFYNLYKYGRNIKQKTYNKYLITLSSSLHCLCFDI